MERAKAIASNELLMDQLQNLDWIHLWLRLMGRCFWILRERYGIKWSNDELQEFSRDVISEIISKIFIEKKRKWNIDRYPDFEEFIIGAIDSHINNTLKKKDKELSIGDNEHILNNINEFDSGHFERLTIDVLRKQVFDKLQEAGADDDELMIFECLADGIEKPDDIKNELGMSKSDFHNAWRKFKRRRKVIQQKLAAHED